MRSLGGNTYLRNNKFQKSLRVRDLVCFYSLLEMGMSVQNQAPACHLSWTVTRVSPRLYAVAATSNGADYDFVGNYRSLSDAHQAGRLFARQAMHRIHAASRDSVSAA